jgi:hypothetical protein
MEFYTSFVFNTILYENEFQNPQIFQQTFSLFPEQSTLVLLWKYNTHLSILVLNSNKAAATHVGLELEFLLNRSGLRGNQSQDSGAPLSPDQLSSNGSSIDRHLAPMGRVPSSQSGAAIISSAVSNESVAGDSGVFEASSPTKHLQGGDAEKLTSLMAAMSFEAAQVQIKMKYDREDSLLHVSVEKARNLRALVINPNRKL